MKQILSCTDLQNKGNVTSHLWGIPEQKFTGLFIFDPKNTTLYKSMHQS